MWMSVKHKEKKALDIWAREIASAGTGKVIIHKSLGEQFYGTEIEIWTGFG